MTNKIAGIAASPGIKSGCARLVLTDEDLLMIGEGDVIVAKFTTPFFTPYILRVGAIITDIGGITSHAATIARELGIPAVVGTQRATSVIANGYIVTVDGSKGIIYYE